MIEEGKKEKNQSFLFELQKSAGNSREEVMRTVGGKNNDWHLLQRRLY